MKHECDIVRDLMPMVVDGTASEKSEAMVEEHVAECAPCRDMLDEMRQDVVPEAERQEDAALVRKLRGRRRVRTALLVLLGMALCAVLAFVGWRGWSHYWNYNYNDYCMLTAEEDYKVEVVEKDLYHAQVILTMEDGHAQTLNFWLDEENADLYIWSTTTRKPKSAQSVWSVTAIDGLYSFGDTGYAMRCAVYDEQTQTWRDDVMPVGRVLKGAPAWYAGSDGFCRVLFELTDLPDETLYTKWRERLEAWGVFDEGEPEAPVEIQ